MREAIHSESAHMPRRCLAGALFALMLSVSLPGMPLQAMVLASEGDATLQEPAGDAADGDGASTSGDRRERRDAPKPESPGSLSPADGVVIGALVGGAAMAVRGMLRRGIARCPCGCDGCNGCGLRE